MLTRPCKLCSKEFQITENDGRFYSQIDVDAPTLCPDCRQQRRLTYRNERKFYKRKCDLGGEGIISVYSPQKECKVFCQNHWWSDSWNPEDFGTDFDFSKPFFEQFYELSKVVPRPCMIAFSSENSEYTNHSAYNKNCYMCINTGWCEDLLYCTNYNLNDKNCVDCLSIKKCELCYFCVDAKNCYSGIYLHECVDCADCGFCYDCHSCQNCFMCWNLRRKQYCILNKQFSREEYQKKMAAIMPKTRQQFMQAFESFKTSMQNKAIHKAAFLSQCENCTGDHLHHNKNVKNSYYVFDSQDCSHCYDCGEIKNCVDAYEPFKGELQYETHGCNSGYKILACSKCYENNDLSYCQYCWNSSNLFGCFGMKRKQYCVLNKQYPREEYEKLVPQIIAHMKKTGEWGEFFPSKFSPFAYNETAAQDYYPLTEEQTSQRGFAWIFEDPKTYVAQTYKMPGLISDVSDEVLNEILKCEKCGKNFRIIFQELDFYRQMKLPLPDICHDCRHLERVSMRSPRRLWDRECVKCSAPVSSVYSPDRPEIIYCERCYLAAVY